MLEVLKLYSREYIPTIRGTADFHIIPAVFHPTKNMGGYLRDNVVPHFQVTYIFNS